MAHLAASLIGFSYHCPGKMPTLETLLSPKGKRSASSAAPGRQTTAEAASNIRAWRIALGGTVEAPAEGEPAGPPPSPPAGAAAPAKRRSRRKKKDAP